MFCRLLRRMGTHDHRQSCNGLGLALRSCETRALRWQRGRPHRAPSCGVAAERPVRQRLDTNMIIVRGRRAIGARVLGPTGGAARGDGRDVGEHGRTRGPSRSGRVGDTIRAIGSRRVPPSTSRALGLSIDGVPRIAEARLSRTPNRRLHQTPVVGFAPAHGSPREAQQGGLLKQSSPTSRASRGAGEPGR